MGSTTARVTLADVARVAGVSTQTVSNALNAPEKLRPATLQRVIHVVDSLGYRPNRHARSLRTAAARAIGVRSQEPVDHGAPLQDRFLHALAEEARVRDYLLVLFSTHLEDELNGYADLVRANAADAFVLTDSHREDPRPDVLTTLGVPFVAFGRPWQAEQRCTHPWVDVDGAAGTRLAVDHLASRGYRSIGFLGWPEGSETGDDRARGWADAVRDRGLTCGPLVRACNDVDEAATAVATVLDTDGTPDAIVCVSDTLAAGVYRALAARGHQPGVHLAVVGFDDGPVATMLPVPLTTVSQPVERVARVVMDMLDALIAGEAPDESAVLLEPTLTVRAST